MAGQRGEWTAARRPMTYFCGGGPASRVAPRQLSRHSPWRRRWQPGSPTSIRWRGPLIPRLRSPRLSISGSRWTSLPIRPNRDSLRGDLATESQFQDAKRLLGERLRVGDRWAALAARTITQTTAMSVPLPKARPARASVDLQLDRATRSDERTFFQKLADLLPARATFASLTPNDDTPNLRSLGYDSLSAVYDISAHAVYLPSGSRLEAHSGYGGLRDDPGHVSERNAGATPPAVYELKPREQLFHGVPALRMIPAQGSPRLDGMVCWRIVTCLALMAISTAAYRSRITTGSWLPFRRARSCAWSSSQIWAKLHANRC